MYVGVIHRISDPEAFRAAEDRALATGFPSELVLPVRALARDCTVGMSIWKAESVAAVRDAVEMVVGAFAKSEYVEVEVHGLQ